MYTAQRSVYVIWERAENKGRQLNRLQARWKQFPYIIFISFTAEAPVFPSTYTLPFFDLCVRPTQSESNCSIAVFGLDFYQLVVWCVCVRLHRFFYCFFPPACIWISSCSLQYRQTTCRVMYSICFIFPTLSPTFLKCKYSTLCARTVNTICACTGSRKNSDSSTQKIRLALLLALLC